MTIANLLSGIFNYLFVIDEDDQLFWLNTAHCCSLQISASLHENKIIVYEYFGVLNDIDIILKISINKYINIIKNL
jgi:hypothetical protein